MTRPVHIALLLILVFLSGNTFSVWAANEITNSDLSAAKKLIEQQRYQEAITLMVELRVSDKNPEVDITLGDTYITLENPMMALFYYEAAYDNAKLNNNEVMLRIALFRLARVQLRLSYAQKAAINYQTLLKMKLSQEDQVIAEEGLKRAQEILFGEKLQQAIILVEQEKGAEAYALIQDELATNNKSFRLQIVAAQSLAMMENPKQALSHYQQALTLSDSTDQKKTALMGIVKMQYWLGEDSTAQQTLSQLKELPLSQQDKEQINELVAASGMGSSIPGIANEISLAKGEEIILGEKLQRAITLLEKEKGVEAYALIEDELGKNTRSFRLQMIAGQSLAIMERPKEALSHFQQALSLSELQEQKKAALLNILKMQYWLAEQKAAKETLRQLQALSLTPDDKQQISKLTAKFFSKTRSAGKIAKPADTLMDNIRSALKKEDPKKAFILLTNYPNKTTYLYYLSVGDTLFLLEDPRNSLDYYQAAYMRAANEEEKKAALFGIGKTALWLEEYNKALDAYQQLKFLPLNRDDQEIVTTGLVIALTNIDYPYKAFLLVGNQHLFNYPMSVMAATRAALYSGLAYKAKAIWLANALTLQKVPPDNFLQRQIREINWLLLQDTSTSSMGTNYYTVKDTDNFRIIRQSADYSYRTFGINSNTTLTAGQNFYLDPQNSVMMDTVSLRQTLINLGDHLDLDFTAATADLHYSPTPEDAWHPFLWRTGFFFHPNDYWSFAAYNSQEVVEAIPALQNKIQFNTSEGTLIIHPISRVYSRFSLFHNEFTDENRRDGESIAVNYLLMRQLALFTEFRYRNYRNSLYSNGNYFSPAKLEEKSINLILKRRISATWAVYTEGGIGRQAILPTPFDEEQKAPTFSYDLNITGALTNNLRVNVIYGYSQNAFGSFVGSYARTYFAINFKLFMN
ncbi:hypothetical protein [Legionella cardiaca]|uniref:TRP containing protein n=1 Tax=Legionella cardiaca TaxID=1071983 RepID=A0ABY8ATH5_9GAMM|nr:hypothetical protein [Legionella cardiaca]WED43074.1 hypothetical protein PXX05_14425 [Legionella cardiaca]